MLAPTTKRSLEQFLWTFQNEDDSRDIYLILDGATVRKLPDACEQLEAPHGCLFKGEEDPAILVRAPWLVKLVKSQDTLQWFIEEGWGKNWGVIAFVPQGVPFEEVLKHFRQFVQVRLPDQKIVFFRFFDPRILRLFLPTCDAGQLQQFFSLPTALLCEAEDPDTILTFGTKGGALTKNGTALRELQF